MSVYLFIMFPIRDCERSELTSAGCREVSQTTIYTTIVRLIVRLLYEVSRFFFTANLSEHHDWSTTKISFSKSNV